jgi:uncharacterized protein (TIGR00251 family)
MAWSDALTPTPQGCFIHLHVTPNSDTTLFPGHYHPWRHTLDIHITSPAKDNQANQEIIQLLSDFFQLPKTNITIIKGQKSRQKTLHLKNLNINKAKKILEEHINGL